MALPRRVPAAPPPPAQSGGTVNFGDDAFYTGGLGLQEGNYAATFHTQMFQPTKQNGQPTGAAVLAVMLTAYPILEGVIAAEGEEHPLSCGTKAHLSFTPSEDGKGFLPIPGGPAIGMSNLANWAIFFDSLKKCGLPPNLVSNDLSVIDGIWIHTRNIPEPEERRGLRTATGEAALGQQQSDRAKVTAVVTEILEGGKPWEGGGGFAAETPKPAPRAVPGRRAVAAPVAAPRVAAPVARTVARPAQVVAPVEPATEAGTEEEVAETAMQGVAGILEQPKYINGCTTLTLRTSVFAAIGKQFGDEMAQAVMATYFVSDDALNVLLSPLGYVSENKQVKVIAA